MMAANNAMEHVMPSFFEISVAAFAIGMATNTNVPNAAPQAPQKSQVIVEQQENVAAAPAPVAETDVAQTNAQPAKTDAPH